MTLSFKETGWSTNLTSDLPKILRYYMIIFRAKNYYLVNEKMHIF